MPQTAESQTGACERICRIGNPYFPQPVPHGVVMGHSTHSGDLHLRKSFSQDASCVRSHPGLWGHSCMHFGWGPQERLALSGTKCEVAATQGLERSSFTGVLYTQLRRRPTWRNQTKQPCLPVTRKEGSWQSRAAPLGTWEKQRPSFKETWQRSQAPPSHCRSEVQHEQPAVHRALLLILAEPVVRL